jgi:hypothetical protein
VAAIKARVATTFSSGSVRRNGNSRIKLREVGIATSEIMFNPKEVTAAMRSSPNRSNIETRN